jgi:hypothetical protein
MDWIWSNNYWRGLNGRGWRLKVSEGFKRRRGINRVLDSNKSERVKYDGIQSFRVYFRVFGCDSLREEPRSSCKQLSEDGDKILKGRKHTRWHVTACRGHTSSNRR